MNKATWTPHQANLEYRNFSLVGAVLAGTSSGGTGLAWDDLSCLKRVCDLFGC